MHDIVELIRINAPSRDCPFPSAIFFAQASGQAYDASAPDDTQDDAATLPDHLAQAPVSVASFQ